MYHNRIEADEKLCNKIRDFESEKKEMIEHYEGEIRKQEELFLEERTKIKEQLHNVTSNEVNLFNRYGMVFIFDIRITLQFHT